jgi:hypothetical protein
VYQLPIKSGNDAEYLAGVNGLPFFDVKPFDYATFRRTDFVLHLHRFHDNEALAGLDFVSRFDKDANNFAWHGSDYLLAALGFERTMPTASPGPRISNLGGEFLEAGLELEHPVR